MVQCERYVNECRDLVHGLRNNSIPAWLLEALAERSGVKDIDKSKLAEYLYTEVQIEFNGYVCEGRMKASEGVSMGQRMKETRDKNKKDISKIKLNHLYTYNDYSDGNWKFHKIDYAIILGVRYNETTARSILVNLVTELFRQGKIDRDRIVRDERFNGNYKVVDTGGFTGQFYLEDYDVYISTAYSIDNVDKVYRKVTKVC